MKNSTFEQPLPYNLAKNMSNGYIHSNNAYTAEPFEYVQVGPAGSMSSTAEDMSKFMIAHLQDGRSATPASCRRPQPEECTVSCSPTIPGSAAGLMVSGR